jgi:YegS/Rv2252/BmrU family lipid kinase
MSPAMIIIGNPGAGTFSRQGLAAAVGQLAAAGVEAGVFLTRAKGDAEIEARRIARHNGAFVVAAGGDGTVNDVANGLAGSPVPLGILPMGTVNVLSREVGIPKDVGGAVLKLLHGQRQPVSLGRITAAGGTHRCFMLMADIGYGGSTVAGLNERIRCISSRTAFVVSGARHLVRTRPQELRFIIDGVEHRGYHAIVGKVSRYGGNFRVTPEAAIQKPDLHVCLFQGGRRTDLARYVYGVFRSRHQSFKDVVSLKCREIVVEGTAHIQIDGNYYGRTPVRIDTLENGLNLIY